MLMGQLILDVLFWYSIRFIRMSTSHLMIMTIVVACFEVSCYQG